MPDPDFLTTDGELSVEQTPGGAVLSDTRRQPSRTFRITGGTNPYSAQEIYTDDEAGTVADYPEGYVLDATLNAGLLWELTGDGNVPIGARVIAYPNPVGPGFVFLYGRLLLWRVTGNNGSTSTPLYSGVRAYETAPGAYADVSPTVSVSNKLTRIPSNSTTHSTSSDPPFVPVNQHVQTELDPDQAGYYRIVNAAGGLIEVGPVMLADCTSVYLIGRDLSTHSASPPPPSPPVAPAWYCVDDGLGGRTCAYYTTTPPVTKHGGPYSDKTTCVGAC